MIYKVYPLTKLKKIKYEDVNNLLRYTCTKVYHPQVRICKNKSSARFKKPTRTAAYCRKITSENILHCYLSLID